MLKTVDIITSLSLVVAALALIMAAVTYWLFRRDLRALHLTEKGLEATSIVEEFGQRSKRLEQEIVDQKVKLEVMELRMRNNRESLQGQRPSRTSVPSPTSPSRLFAMNDEVRHPDFSRASFSSSPSETPSRTATQRSAVMGRAPRIPGTEGIVVPLGPELEMDNHEFSKSEREALRIVMESGRTTAKEIQNRIDRTREHTARLMNSLYKEGLVERNSTARPFAYSISQKGKEKLGV